jgi:hypothetical protein
VGHVLGCVTEQEGPVVEFEPHSLRGCTRPGGFNLWVSTPPVPVSVELQVSTCELTPPVGRR